MEVKKSEEILAEIYRNCQLALESISDILPEIEDEGIKAEILRQHEEYEKICGRAACLARDKALELKEPNPMKKAMMWGSIKMNTLTDNSRAHIAEMMIQGTAKQNPKEMAHYILEQVLSWNGEVPLDDMTVLVVGIWEV